MLQAALFPPPLRNSKTWSNGGDGLWRFMPSIAVDQSGNTAIGYAASSSSHVPGHSLCGRLASDPPSNLGQGETTMFTALEARRHQWTLGRL